MMSRCPRNGAGIGAKTLKIQAPSTQGLTVRAAARTKPVQRRNSTIAYGKKIPAKYSDPSFFAPPYTSPKYRVPQLYRPDVYEEEQKEIDEMEDGPEKDEKIRTLNFLRTRNPRRKGSKGITIQPVFVDTRAMRRGVKEIRYAKRAMMAKIIQDYDFIACLNSTNVSAMTWEQVKKGLPEGAKLTVFKKTLLTGALKETPWSQFTTVFEPGLCAFLLCKEDAIAPSIKEIIKAQKTMAKMEFPDGFKIYGSAILRPDSCTVLDGKKTEALAKLPTREELYAQIAGSINAVAGGVARAINAVPQKVGYAVNAVKDSKSD